MVGLPGAILANEPSAVALIEGDRRVTYGELADRMLRTAGGLIERGVAPGTRVPVACTTSIDGVVAYLGVKAAAAVAVMLNYRAARPELVSRLALADPTVVVVGGSVLPDLPPERTMARPAGSTSHDEIPCLDRPRTDRVAVDEGSPAAVLFTSGVSGEPRAVALSHRNLNAVQFGQVEQTGTSLSAATTALLALPLAHIFGLNSVLGTLLRAGATVVLTERFDPIATAALVAEHGIDTLAAVPQMWRSLSEADVPASSFATLTRATSSAAPLAAATAQAMRARFGVSIVGGYGLTETSGTICLDDPAAPRADSVGRPLGGTEIRLVDRDGIDAEDGDTGEVWLRGPSLCSSYRSAGGMEPVADAAGWFRTGDVGVFDGDGRLSIVDRIKDVVIVGGFNVSPTEVETVLLQHPGVAGVAVVGEPDDRSGERIVAYVSPSESGATAQELTDHCRRQLARYKVPVRFEVREDLPFTESGKVLRRLLR